MKKINTSTWIILAGIFLYTATLWQRPLFVFEFTEWGTFADNACKGIFPLSRHLELFILKNAGGTPFFFRIFTALLTLLAALMIFLSGLKSTFPNSAKGGAIIFLLTPAIFLCGTSASPALQQGALLTAALYALWGCTQTDNWKNALPAGIAATLFLTGMVTLFTAPILYLTAFAVLFLTLICLKQYTFKAFALLLLPFIPGIFFLCGTSPEVCFHLPCKAGIKTLAAFMAAGTFPWIVFTPVLLKNSRSRLAALCKEPFTCFCLLLFVCALAGALFTTGATSLALATAALSGAAVVWAALMEMEHLENGSHLFDKTLRVLAVLFFLGAAAVGGYALLTLYTKVIPPALRLFTAKDAWALTALVPVVSGIWFIAGAGEKVYKERKFLAFCAGTAFALLAFHGLVPLKTVENNAPVKFLKQAVAPRLTRSAAIYCDTRLFAPAAAVFKSRTLEELDIEKVKAAAKARKSFCVLTLSRKTSDALPFPKTTLRSGRFTAVFYNIDFPEMRVRKP